MDDDNLKLFVGQLEMASCRKSQGKAHGEDQCLGLAFCSELRTRGRQKSYLQAPSQEFAHCQAQLKKSVRTQNP